MSERISNGFASLDEVEAHASTVAHGLVADAIGWTNDKVVGDEVKRAPAAILAYSLAAAIVYHAERQVDAADRVRDGLLAIADSMQGARDPMLIERLAGIESELYRLANTAGDAFMAHADPARRKERGNDEK